MIFKIRNIREFIYILKTKSKSNKMVVFKVNKILSATEDFRKTDVSLSWIVVIFAIIIALITVLISEYILARKVGTVEKNMRETIERMEL